MVGSGHDERRATTRVTFIHEVEVEGLGKRRCLDIGAGGMYLESAVSFPPSTIIDLKFNLKDSDPEPIRTKARVMYVHEGVGMGLAFVELARADFDRIKQFVETL